MIWIIPSRFLLFAALSAGWLAAMQMTGASTLLYAAGLAWFATWLVQAMVSVAFWIWPFSLPTRYYRPIGRRGRRWSQAVSRACGLEFYRRAARRIHPLRCGRRSLSDLESAIRAAETTHIVAFGVVSMLALFALIAGQSSTAISLVVWNVICNFYPAAVQRYTRARLDRVSRCAAAAGRFSSGSPIRITSPSRT